MGRSAGVSAYVVGFGRPDLLQEQKRLIDKFCPEISGLCCVDNSPVESASRMEEICRLVGVGYMKTPEGKSQHPDALRHIVTLERELKSEYWITLDHDVFPRREVTLVDKIDKSGFFGIGQTHPPTQKHYLWPGFCSFSRKWLNGREPNFDGIRGQFKRDDGDCGSMLWSLFTEEDWEKMYLIEHGYGSIRPKDDYGLQSFGYEFFDGWVHFTNASHWMQVPDPLNRDRMLREMIKEL
jgi:hypothetical protein